MEKTINVAFIGNPNCGKTTLFNRYTGANLKVANWPGVTVEKKEGYYKYDNYNLKLVDLPGIYSLSSYSIEEIVSKNYIFSEDVDIIVDVIDASSLERNLYLATQLVELGKPVVLAMNMMDIVKERGMRINFEKLTEIMGVPCVPISARKRIGLNELMDAVVHYKKDSKHTKIHRLKIDIYNNTTDSIKKRYDFVEQVTNKCLINKEKKQNITNGIDKILINKFLGIPIFLIIMACVFFLTFTIGDAIKAIFEIGLEKFSEIAYVFLQKIGVDRFFTSLVVDGIIAGVGGILTFLPNIFILFLALAFLEDSGYMSRVAYVMNGIMEKIGLSGKAFIPMVLGFGCTVPAIMASRTLENKKDRIKTILITPFMSCSAKIPIYVLFAGIFFPGKETIVAFSMYLIGLIVAIIIALIMKVQENSKHSETLLIELPEYKVPNFNSIRIYVWEKIKDYLTKAGTTIFVSSIALWVILNFSLDGMVDNAKYSFGAKIGELFDPLLNPAGLGYWQIALALISGLSAKEVVVSSMNVIYGVESSKNLMPLLMPSGFSSLNAYCLMIFCLLYTPCIATIATIKKETNSSKWCLISIGLQSSVAWLVATLIYQIGTRI